MERPSFKIWPEICDDLKLQIIARMSYKTRRHLRNCSKKDKQLVDRLPWRRTMSMHCRFCATTGKWFCQYYCGTKYLHALYPHHKEYFDTCEKAYEQMKKVINTVETISKLTIDLKLDWKIALRDGRQLKNVDCIVLNFVGGESNGAKLECYDYLFSQIRALRLKNVCIGLNELRSSNPVQNEDLFEFEKTAMNLKHFNFDGLISDEQLLGIRTKSVYLGNASSITPSGFVKFIQKQLLQAPPILNFNIQKISSELEFYLFGAVYMEYQSHRIAFLLKVPNSNLKLKISFTAEKNDDDDEDEESDEDGDDDDMEDDEEPDIDYNDDYDSDDDMDDERTFNTSVHIQIVRQKNFPDCERHAVNNEALEICPSLEKFINDVSEIIEEED